MGPLDEPSQREDDILAAALGTENTAGYHVELYYQTTLFWSPPRRGDGSRFPCVDAENRYAGCLGDKCRAESCWSGKLVPSAVNAARERVPLPRVERRGARCHMCSNAISTPEGFIDCAAGHFDRPITTACLFRRRIPESAPIPCPDLERGDGERKRQSAKEPASSGS